MRKIEVWEQILNELDDESTLIWRRSLKLEEKDLNSRKIAIDDGKTLLHQFTSIVLDMYENPNVRGEIIEYMKCNIERLRWNMKYFVQLRRGEVGFPIPRSLHGLNIAILAYPYDVLGQWDQTVSQNGLGGSEEAILHISQELVRLGHRVVVYCNPPDHSPWSLPFSNPQYLHEREFVKVPDIYDICVIWRRMYFPVAKTKSDRIFFWPHDIPYGYCPDGDVKLLSGCLFLSRFQASLYKRNYSPMNDIPSVICGNGIESSYFRKDFLPERVSTSDERLSFYSDISSSPAEEKKIEVPVEEKKIEVPVEEKKVIPPQPSLSYEQLLKRITPFRDSSKCVYISNYSRGLQTLIDVWPLIRKKHNDATLDIYFGRETYGTMSDLDRDNLVRSILEISFLGVREMGRVDEISLARALESASVLAYPCNTVSEIYCINVVKSQAAGCIPITIDIGGLRETVDPTIQLISPISDEEGMKRYASVISDCIRQAKMGYLGNLRKRIRDSALQKTWKRASLIWESQFTGLVHLKQRDGSKGMTFFIPSNNSGSSPD